ncbi:hypothetical protein A2W70_03085 [Candidatus Curtissbacteria bacterium RIFCSPLOWO2_02_41_11]|uniref:Bacterial spore germination immunoglobulin-like domain-containing protein n=2 Tax=Candidatus Curtissiibacteriota TaxID=1752717 RepID=A0A1F5HUL6_9BACT|nr:MAG: hypothetical protein UU56_C0002G0057 [Candidatus Curtissbacteria bacterium GW2011_GWA2_41_24]OGE07851.1 MAG: hypothetical protein A2W70_03085 [Candidatus Curtissbacteria bacterium RIFCSPLOWO2_02_41_11]
MRNNLSFVVGAVVLIIFFALVAFAASKFYQRQSEKKLSPSPRPSPVSGFPTASPSPETLGQANVPAAQPESGSNTLEEKNIRIFIENPAPSSLISSPLKISGLTNLTSGIIMAQVKDANGQLLGQNQTSACTTSDSCSFQTEIVLVSPQTQSGLVEVFNLTEDNSEAYRQSTSVRFW